VTKKLMQSLLLIGRANDYRWVNNQLVARLLKSLSTVMVANKSDQVNWSSAKGCLQVKCHTCVREKPMFLVWAS
jgi:hypothetical protein